MPVYIHECLEMCFKIKTGAVNISGTCPQTDFQFSRDEQTDRQTDGHTDRGWWQLYCSIYHPFGTWKQNNYIEPSEKLQITNESAKNYFTAKLQRSSVLYRLSDKYTEEKSYLSNSYTIIIKFFSK